MKKALVLGVLAIFAISIANVNAQDRTNVQQKGKKPSVTQITPSKDNGKTAETPEATATTTTASGKEVVPQKADRTNVSQKPKKNYDQEPNSKTDGRAIGAAGTTTPGGKTVSPLKVQGTKGGKKVGKGKIDAGKTGGIMNNNKAGGASSTIGSTEKGVSHKDDKGLSDDEAKAKALEEEAIKEKNESMSEQDRTSVNAKNGKKTNVNNSVPPVSKEKQTATGQVTTDR